MNWLKILKLILINTLITSLFYLIIISVNSRLNQLDNEILPEKNTTIQSTISTTTQNHNQPISVSPRSILRTINLTRINYIHNIPSICGKNTSLQLLTAIISSPDQLTRRSNLRKTWAKPLATINSTVLIFFIGQSKDNSINNNVISEANETSDVVIVDFEESYRNLTLKVLLMLRWAKEYCSNAKFILKADDDMFINVYNLVDFINNKETNNSFFYGRVGHDWPPVRFDHPKWKVTEEEYSGSVYPDLVTGPTYLIGTKYIDKLYNICLRLPHLYLEDVFITGICAEKAEISRIHHEGFINEPIFEGGVCKLLDIVSLHNINSEKLEQMWKSINDLNFYKYCNNTKIPVLMNKNTEIKFKI